MKAIIIENEYEVPSELRGFLSDNPKLFTDVNEQIGCRFRPIEDLGRFIKEADAVLVQSTWMYKDQLETFVQVLASGLLGKKKYFIYKLLYHLNDWNYKDPKTSEFSERYFFDDLEVFLANIKKLVQEQEVYSIEENDNQPSNEWTKQDFFLTNYKRPDLLPIRIHYSEQMDVFYLEDQDPAEVKQELQGG